MPEDYTVQQGDCFSSIAFDFGFFWKTLWDLPENDDLKRDRKDPFVLYAGDRVCIPELRLRSESGATETRHRFQLKGVPFTLRLQLLRAGLPRANQDYVIKIDDMNYTGKTDGNGNLQQKITPNAQVAKVVVGLDKDEYLIYLGHLDPITTNKGVQQRLNNLAYYCGSPDGIIGPRTQGAIRQFQLDNSSAGLEATGKLDNGTRKQLERVHGR